MVKFVCGRLAQLVRASGLHPEGPQFESVNAHHEAHVEHEFNDWHGHPKGYILSYSFTVSKGLPCASVLNGLLHRFSVVANYDMMSGDHLAVSSEYQVDRRTISFP